MARSVIVMTSGIQALPEPDKTIALEALTFMARIRKPEPSMLSITPTIPKRLSPPKRLELARKGKLFEDGGRTLLVHDPLISNRIWVKKDDWRRAAREDKKSFGVPVDTDYVITAMLPEEY